MKRKYCLEISSALHFAARSKEHFLFSEEPCSCNKPVPFLKPCSLKCHKDAKIPKTEVQERKFISVHIILNSLLI